MRTHIRMLDAPQKGFTAFMPSMAVTTPAASSQGLLRTEGHPGTRRVPSPRPAALNDSELGGPFNQPSPCSPDYIRPSQYIPHADNCRAPVAVRSTNVAPVKVPNISRSPGQTQYKTRIGGRTVTAWPRQFVRWPTYLELGGR